jgi:hypothetical protein
MYIQRESVYIIMEVVFAGVTTISNKSQHKTTIKQI